MAQLTWQNVNADGLNGAVANAQKASDTMYSRVGDLVRAGQGLLGDMQTGIQKKWEFDREENTQEVINRMHEADSLEEIKSLQDSLSVGSIRNQYGNKIDLSKVNQAKATWVSDAEARANKLNGMKDYSDDAIKLRSQVESLITAGEVEKARQVLEQNAGMLSNGLTDKLTQAIIDKHHADRNYGLDARRVSTTEAMNNAQINRLNSETVQSQYRFNQELIDKGTALLNDMDKAKQTLNSVVTQHEINANDYGGKILVNLENAQIDFSEKQEITDAIKEGKYARAAAIARSKNLVDVADDISNYGYYVDQIKSAEESYNNIVSQHKNTYMGLVDKSVLPESMTARLNAYFGNNTSGSNGSNNGTTQKNSQTESFVVNNTGGITTSSSETVKNNSTVTTSGSNNNASLSEAEKAQQGLVSSSVTMSPIGERTSQALAEKVNGLESQSGSRVPTLQLNKGTEPDDPALREYYRNRAEINASNLSLAQKNQALNNLKIKFDEKTAQAEAKKYDIGSDSFTTNIEQAMPDILARNNITAGSEISGLTNEAAIRSTNTAIELSKLESHKALAYFRDQRAEINKLPPDQRKLPLTELESTEKLFKSMDKMYDAYSRDVNGEKNEKTGNKYGKQEFYEKERSSIAKEARKIINDRVERNANEQFGTREQNPSTRRVIDSLKSPKLRINTTKNGIVTVSAMTEDGQELGSNEEIIKALGTYTKDSLFDAEDSIWDSVDDDEPLNFLNSNILTIKDNAVKTALAKSYIDMTADYAKKIKEATTEDAKNKLREDWQKEKKSFLPLAQNVRPQDLTTIHKQALDADARTNELLTDAGQNTLMLTLANKSKNGESLRKVLYEDKTYGLAPMSTNPIYSIPAVYEQARELENKIAPLMDRIDGVSKASNEKEIDKLKTQLIMAQERGSDTSEIETKLAEAQEKGAKGLSGISVQEMAYRIGDINLALKQARNLAKYDPEVWQPRVEALEKSYDTIVRYQREVKDAHQALKQ